ncbi:hypothetical protein D3C76_27670 [compost metagenome]
MAVANLHKFLDALVKKLFAAEERRLDKIVETLDQRNREIGGHRPQGFLLQGKLYRPSNATLIAIVGIKPLAYELSDDGNKFLKDRNQIDQDRQSIKQILYKLVEPCQNAQEIRDTLPECLVSLVPELSKMERRFATGFFAPKDDRFVRQYEAILPKIEMYSVSCLLY